MKFSPILFLFGLLILVSLLSDKAISQNNPESTLQAPFEIIQAIYNNQNNLEKNKRKLRVIQGYLDDQESDELIRETFNISETVNEYVSSLTTRVNAHQLNDRDLRQKLQTETEKFKGRSQSTTLNSMEKDLGYPIMGFGRIDQDFSSFSVVDVVNNPERVVDLYRFLKDESLPIAAVFLTRVRPLPNPRSVWNNHQIHHPDYDNREYDKEKWVIYLPAPATYEELQRADEQIIQNIAIQKAQALEPTINSINTVSTYCPNPATTNNIEKPFITTDELINSFTQSGLNSDFDKLNRDILIKLMKYALENHYDHPEYNNPEWVEQERNIIESLQELQTDTIPREHYLSIVYSESTTGKKTGNYGLHYVIRSSGMNQKPVSVRLMQATLKM